MDKEKIEIDIKQILREIIALPLVVLFFILVIPTVIFMGLLVGLAYLLEALDTKMIVVFDTIVGKYL